MATAGTTLTAIAVQIGGYLRGHAKTRVALREELPVSLRPRLAEFTAADWSCGMAKGPSVPAVLDPVRDMTGCRNVGVAASPGRRMCGRLREGTRNGAT